MEEGLQKALAQREERMADCPSNKIRKIRIAAAKAKEEEWKNFCTAYI